MKDIIRPIRRLHGRFHEWCINVLPIYAERYKKPKAVFLVMTPAHTNIGDQAIALAETQLLNRLGINYIELTDKKCKELRNNNQLGVMNSFPIIVNGGGNLATLWMNVESLQRQIILSNPDSPILFLPNTIYYEDSEFGKEEFEKSKEIYNNHAYLSLCARENTSYQLMKNEYKNVKLIPDIVMSLPPYNKQYKRSGCLLCLRNDREKTIDSEQQNALFNICNTMFPGQVRYTDMMSQSPVNIDQRKSVVENKFDEFCGVELVVTDRLHGMIFCAITGTPCIVIDSKSPKVRGCYEWIKNLPYIRFAESVEDVLTEYMSIPHQQFTFDNSELLPYFELLAEEINQMCVK